MKSEFGNARLAAVLLVGLTCVVGIATGAMAQTPQGACAADSLYLDTADEGPHEAFLSFISEKHLHSISFLDPPWKKQFYVGVSTCADWLKSGKLKLHGDSETLAELKAIAKESLEDSPMENYPYIDSLRFVMAGFKRDSSSRRGQPHTPPGTAREQIWI